MANIGWLSSKKLLCTSFRYLLLRSSICSIKIPARHLRPLDFLVVGPTVWNFLPDFIRDLTISADCFRHLLKPFLSSMLQHLVHLGFLTLMCYINLLTYLLVFPILASHIFVA